MKISRRLVRLICLPLVAFSSINMMSRCANAPVRTFGESVGLTLFALGMFILLMEVLTDED